jgi:alpha-L-arabinofuranosidase
MKSAKYILDKDYRIGEVDRRLFGSFVEHIHNVIYDGIYEPGHPQSDEQGFRKDVIAATKQANVTHVRYPGGNFVSGYHWTDGIGPVAERKTRLNLAWNILEPNKVGIDEFADWAKKAHVEVTATVNLGTGTPQEAGEMVEYCNYPSGTYWSDLRRKNGHVNPYRFKLWCLGNEMDGPWQIGKLSPEDYGKKALETAKIMQWTDPSIEMVVCGSSFPEMPTYPEYDRIVLEHTYEKADYISLHRYFQHTPWDGFGYPSIEDKTDIAYCSIELQGIFHTVLSAADYVKTKKRSSKVINISYDEWNVLRQHEDFTLRDALIYGGLLCTFLKNADRVKIACQSLLVNAGGLFKTFKDGGLVIAPTFYPFQLMAGYSRGTSMLDQVSGPRVKTNHHDEVPALQTSAVYNEEDGSVNVFVVNFDPEDDTILAMDLRSFGNLQMVEHLVMEGDLEACNSIAAPDAVKPASKPIQPVINGKVDVVVSGSSWNMFRFSVRS